ncbi:hypothetical protein AMELA_G00293300 [Ameiurus melas]|uniref:Uncharacterized protein n=1 Tax=Ameiurus melas TaxID=219545 RepID=A0A7J5ZI18_AMEME|nr:hypothetical protein AMELA_G00293300 [Ameiurus melas]
MRDPQQSVRARGHPPSEAGMIEYDDRQEALLRALQQNVGQQVQMVVVILSTNCKEKYACVKKYLCVDCPTPSQKEIHTDVQAALMLLQIQQLFAVTHRGVPRWRAAERSRPKLTVLVVKKRSSSRFFLYLRPQTEQPSSRNSDSSTSRDPRRRTYVLKTIKGYTVLGAQDVPPQLLSQREMKWLEMLKNWDKWINKRFKKSFSVL